MALDANLQVGLKSSGELFTASNGIAMASVHHHVTAPGWIFAESRTIHNGITEYVRTYVHR